LPPALEGATVLDLGCGSGRDTFILSKLVGPNGQVIAQDFFTDEIGRALVLGGAAEGSKAYAVLEEIAGSMDDRPIARHARLSLGLPKMKANRVVHVPDGKRPMSSIAADGGAFGLVHAKPEEARRLLEAALHEGDGADTLGTVRLARMLARYTGWLQREGGDRPGKKARPGPNKRR
jgi:SAM-dependent methyltransferase